MTHESVAQESSKLTAVLVASFTEEEVRGEFRVVAFSGTLFEFARMYTVQ